MARRAYGAPRAIRQISYETPATQFLAAAQICISALRSLDPPFRLHMHSLNAPPQLLALQCGQKSFHCRTITTVFPQQEVVFLRGNRQKSQSIKGGYRSDRDAPICAALYDRRGNRIMRPRLIAVARRPHAAEKPIDEQAGAGSGITIDHQAILVGK